MIAFRPDIHTKEGMLNKNRVRLSPASLLNNHNAAECTSNIYRERDKEREMEESDRAWPRHTQFNERQTIVWL